MGSAGQRVQCFSVYRELVWDWTEGKNCTSIKPREPDLLLVVERTQEPQERWPDGYRRIPYGGKTLA